MVTSKCLSARVESNQWSVNKGGYKYCWCEQARILALAFLFKNVRTTKRKHLDNKRKIKTHCFIAAIRSSSV